MHILSDAHSARSSATQALVLHISIYGLVVLWCCAQKPMDSFMILLNKKGTRQQRCFISDLHQTPRGASSEKKYRSFFRTKGSEGHAGDTAMRVTRESILETEIISHSYDFELV
jgi:hypothetical protein